jgi:hypothetical protein
MATIAFVGFASSLVHAAFPAALPRVRYTKNGGMRFLRIGRLQMSWCVCRNSI